LRFATILTERLSESVREGDWIALWLNPRRTHAEAEWTAPWGGGAERVAHTATFGEEGGGATGSHLTGSDACSLESCANNADIHA
jgi:hypothetical protein